MSDDDVKQLMNLTSATARDVGELRKEVKQVNERLGRLETEVAQTNSRLDRLEAEVAQTNSRLDRLEPEVNRIGIDTRYLLTRFDRFEGMVMQARGEGIQNKADIQDLEYRVGELERK